MIDINPLIIVLLYLMDRVIFFSFIRSLSKIIIYMYVKMHIIFVTLTHRYWGEELKGRLMNKKKWFHFLTSSFALICIHNSSAFNYDMKYWQTAALSLVLSLMLSTVCIYIFDCSFFFVWMISSITADYHFESNERQTSNIEFL